MLHEKLLIVDDDQSIRKSLDIMLSMHGYEVITSAGGRDALIDVEREDPDLILTDVNMPGMDGIALLELLKENAPGIGIILITGFGSIEDAVKAMRLGAFDYITKPINDDEILTQIARYFEQKNLRRENLDLRKQLKSRYCFDSIIGVDEKMQDIYDLIETVADTTATVTILGENGTGKSLLARSLHYNSSRSKKPFIEVSCGTLSETLLESELFGHIKGAFTGAIKNKVGKFELADGGTIFLDEIGSASAALQLKLLRVVQERKFEMGGGNDTISVDIRVITASNTDLFQQVQEGNFREDLYYRLNIVQIQLPSLRERMSDIKLLAEHFLDNYCAKHGKHIKGIRRETLEVLQRYHWPGNVRELENCIERAIILSRSDQIGPEDLPPAITDTDLAGKHHAESLSLAGVLEDKEKKIIQEVLARNNWNRNRTAEELEINRTTLFKKMRKYQLLPKNH